MLTAVDVRSKVPEVRGVPGLGCVPWMLRDGPGFLLREARAHGPLFRAKMGPGSLLVVAHPRDLRVVLHEQAKDFVRGNTVDLVRPLLGNGLPLSDGDFWLKQRRTMQPAFNRGHVALLADKMAAVCERRLADVPLGATIDVHRFFTHLARDVIVETMFSDSVANESQRLDEAFVEVSAFAGSRAFLPVKIPIEWPLPSNTRFRNAVATIDTVVSSIVKRRRDGERKGDLLDALLDARDPETGDAMAPEHLRDELVTIFFAGHETTANMLTWAWVELSSHPEWARRMRDELVALAPDRPIVAEDVAKLPVTNAVLREALRLHPPAWIFARQRLEPFALRDYDVRAKEVLLLCPYVTHRLEEYWPNPDVFDPQRFLEANPFTLGGGREIHYLPFGSGPHVCIGNFFAITEGVIAMGALARHGRLQIAEPSRVRSVVASTLTAANTRARVEAW
ncbi:MAG: cytochrome P450 [Myxococcales bacterium]|nr:cytochrome P450 [Myxococcales bacterium]